ncbi:hypothetical protein HN385_03945 [archaeon]|jgi:hypothetical protein|nr:hypothetical protein [archaeon]MBT3450901.1 hypothetical protein [archaeon]MBT6869083.1 hypothetical protein [archaeon]MBT7193326.1 hypothetical protein [archaeon]MBT7380334.1 hypothetical protein [archaeon]
MRYKNTYDELMSIYSDRLDDNIRFVLEPGMFKTSNQIETITEQLYSQKDNVEKLRKKDYNQLSIDELIKVSIQMVSLEDTCQNLQQQHRSIPERDNYELLATKILDISQRIDDGFINIANELKDDFEVRYSSLKNLRPGDIEQAGELRSELNHLISKVDYFEEIFDQRKIDQSVMNEIKSNFNNYMQESKEINSITQNFNNIVETYQSLSTSHEIRKFIRSNLRNFENRIIKGKLLKDCESANYHEMIPKIEFLKEEFNSMLENSEDSINLRNEMRSYLEGLETISDYVDSMGSEDKIVKTKDKVILNRIINNINPDRFSQEKGSIYLDSLVSQVSSTASEIMNKVKQLYQQDFDFEISRYNLGIKGRLLEKITLSDSEENICSMIDNYNLLNQEVTLFLNNQYNGKIEQVKYLQKCQDKIKNHLAKTSELSNDNLKIKFESLNSLIEIYSKRAFFDITGNQTRDYETSNTPSNGNKNNGIENNNSTNINSKNELISFAYQAHQDCQSEELKQICADISCIDRNGYLKPLYKRAGKIKDQLSEIKIEDLQDYERLTYRSIETAMGSLF